jgi:hypothetical protein
VGQFIIAALWLVAVAAPSQADMTNVGWPGTGRASPLVSAPPTAAPAAPLEFHRAAALGLDGTLLPTSATEPQMPLLAGGEAPDAIDLPSGPDSTGLFLSALGTLGAWQLGRSARKLHLGYLPEWYHAEGPSQVGHARVAELDFDGTILWDGGDGLLLEDEHAVSRSLWVEPPPRRSAFDYLTSAAPRGPPLLAA